MITDSTAVVITSVLAWAAIGLSTGWFMHRVDVARLSHDRGIGHLRPWETRSFYRDRLKISRWKDRLPEAGGFFEGGFVKRQIDDRSESHLSRWLAETRRAEYTHWLNIAAAPLFLVVFPLPLAAVHLCFALAVHLPFVAVQRYNGLRLRSAADRVPSTERSNPAQPTSKVRLWGRSGSTRPATPRQASTIG
mgnify:CR=1 FL=1